MSSKVYGPVVFPVLTINLILDKRKGEEVLLSRDKSKGVCKRGNENVSSNLSIFHCVRLVMTTQVVGDGEFFPLEWVQSFRSQRSPRESLERKWLEPSSDFFCLLPLAVHTIPRQVSCTDSA